MRTTETERRQYVEAFHRSGVGSGEFCRKQGLSPKTFYTWRKLYPRALEDDRRTASLTPALVGSSTFLPLQIKDNEVQAGVLVTPPRVLSFKTKKFCLEIPIDTRHSGVELKMIVQTLQEVL